MGVIRSGDGSVVRSGDRSIVRSRNIADSSSASRQTNHPLYTNSPPVGTPADFTGPLSSSLERLKIAGLKIGGALIPQKINSISSNNISSDTPLSNNSSGNVDKGGII